MGLKQDIVIKNEYTIRQRNGRGSRGATPGKYVTRYMARDLATETMEPIRRNNLVDYQMRYMARSDATEVASNREDLKHMMVDAQGSGGVAFGYGDASLSHEALLAGANDIQALFDKGKTVLKTVISFDQEYLEKMGIVEEGFTVKNRGDYRGNIDQMKLRMGIMQGLRRMNTMHYDDLRYIAVIQVDTKHVHCHLAMADAGNGNLAEDGTQKGKLSQRAMSTLRRSMDSYLDEKQTVPHMASAVKLERRNVVTYVKRWAHNQALKESLPQFLIACLPEDRKFWRYGTNHKAMQKPNRIIREIVEDVLSRPDSPMGPAMAKVMTYANERMAREGLSRAEWDRLVHNGREQIYERGVNAVYNLLGTLPDRMLDVRTPMLQAMSADREVIAQMAASNDKDGQDLVGFAFRLRSYGSRLQHHTEQSDHWRSRMREWEEADEAGVAAPESRALYELFVEEFDWHDRLVAKYRSQLAFAPSQRDWEGGWREIEEYGDRLMSLEAMRNDTSIRRMKNLEEAERIGLDAYGQVGGSLVASGGDGLVEINERVNKMRVTWDRKLDDLRTDMAHKGLLLNVKELTADEVILEDEAAQVDPKKASRRKNRRVQRPAGPPVGGFEVLVNPGTKYAYEEVKGLDIHHLRWDFSKDAEVGQKTAARFRAAQQRRSSKLDAALEYLDASGQMDSAGDLPVRDIELMEAAVAEVNATGYLTSTVAKIERENAALRRSKTVELSGILASQIETSVSLATKRAPVLAIEPKVDIQTARAIDAARKRVSGEGRGL